MPIPLKQPKNNFMSTYPGSYKQLKESALLVETIAEQELAEEVVVSDQTLEAYLLNSKSATGIMVTRPV